jgi:hypothetical protein
VTIIGEAFIAVRPLMTGFGEATKLGVDKELAGSDLFGGVTKGSKSAGDDIARNLGAGGTRAEKELAGSGSHIGKTFKSLGESMANWGLPFASSVGKIGSKIDEAEGKTKKLGASMSTMGGLALGVGAIGVAAVAAESVHLASSLQQSSAEIAGHENISVKAAGNITKAMTDTAGKSIFSANTMAASFVPVSGVLEQLNGKALTTGQTMKFLASTGDLAEATNHQLGSTTATAAAVMQSFQIPLSGATGLMNDLYNTSRITGVNVDSLGSTIDRLKARLGIAAPTVGDLSTLLVDLNEHGITGSRGLMVVNTAITTLLQSVPKVDAATAKAANTLATKLTSAGATANSAAAATATAQEAAGARVAKAALHLQQVNETIAASSTAGAPTTSQQISRQNAENALSAAQASASASVTKAQEKQAAAQGKVSALQATAGTSTNLQVKAMQTLGLQVYNTAGTFVGMGSVIAQLQPKLAGMTQEQQLATLTQIFGASASKSLLTTVLAGPVAYDKAQKAITNSTTAHAAAEKQNQTLSRQAELLKATLTDEGDKLGIFLIPKLQDLAKWTAKDVEWFGKHKVVAEVLAGVIATVLGAAISLFLFNKAKAFTKGMVDMGKSMGKFADTVLTKMGIIDKANTDSAGVSESAAAKTEAANATISDSASTTAGKVAGSNTEIVTSADTMASGVKAAVVETQLSFDSLTAGAFAAQEDVQLSFLGISTDVEASAEAMRLAAASMVESEGAIGLGAEGMAAKGALAKGAAGAGAAEAGVAGAGVVGAEGAAGAGAFGTGLFATGALAAPVGASSILPAAIAGFVAFKATGDLLHRNILDSGTAVKNLGNMVAGWFGHSASQTLAKDQKTDATKYLTKADLPYLAGIVSGSIKSSTISAHLAAIDIKALGGKVPTSLGHTDDKLGGQQKVLTQLQTNAREALAAHGQTSSQYLTAEHSLQTTEAKWLPNLAHLEPTAAATKALYIATLGVASDTKKQAGLVAKDGTLAAQKSQLGDLKTQLKTQVASGASETTLSDTRNQIAAAKTNIAQLTSVSQKLSKDATAVQSATKTKDAVDKVNANITKLKDQILTTPPPPQKATGSLKLVPHK